MSNCEVKITFSDEDYKAYADFIPSSGNGAELSQLYVSSVISEAGIKEGIDWDTINSTIDYCNNNKKPKKGVRIAMGTVPVSEVPEHWNLVEKLFQHAMGLDSVDLKVDYKEISNFIMVKKGELLAKKDLGRPGIDGLNVKGVKIPFKKKKIVQFTNGLNTAIHEGNLYAAISGRYEVSENREISVNDVLYIPGNIDYSTGNISFGKDVIIDGEIKDGFKIAAGGSLLCKSNVDASDILCRLDFVAQQGIIGRKEAIIRVGGKINARFIENCQVESKGGIEVEKNIVNCKIYTLGCLDLGENGALVNSHVYAQNCIKAKNIGKQGSQNSELELGFSFVDKRVIESIIQRVDVLKVKLEALVKLPDYRKTDKKIALIKQIEGVVKAAQIDLKIKSEQLYKNPDAYVAVSGSIFPGNTITICGVKYSVTEELKKVKFVLDKANNRIEQVPL